MWMHITRMNFNCAFKFVPKVLTDYTYVCITATTPYTVQ